MSDPVLHYYLRSSNNSVSREYIFNCLLQYQVLIAAAKNRVEIRTFIPSVDRNGFDLILSNGQVNLPIQIKSTVNHNISYKIHKKHIAPSRDDKDIFNLRVAPYWQGASGGVVIICIDDSQDDISINYKYTDILILHTIKQKENTASINNLLFDIVDDNDKRDVTIKSKFFLKCKNALELLELMGLHTAPGTFPWRPLMEEILRAKHPKYNSATDDSWAKSEINKTLGKFGVMI